MITLVDEIVYLPDSDDFLNSNGVLNSMVRHHVSQVREDISEFDRDDLDISITFTGVLTKTDKFTYSSSISCSDEKVKEMIRKKIYGEQTEQQ